jgi:DNA sulfur modification protein DndE
MAIKQVRLSAQAKEQLIRLKTRTGLTQWNILCRWAFCLSLRQPSPPTPVEVPADSNVEMTWQVFGGEAQELYLAVRRSGAYETDWERRRMLARSSGCTRSRHRLPATPHAIRSIADLVGLVAQRSRKTRRRRPNAL